MINNVYLVDLKENELAEIKTLCKSALVSIQGEDAEAKFITLKLKEGKLQLKLNAAKSLTFMSIVSNDFLIDSKGQLDNIFSLRSVYVFQDIHTFKKSMDTNFPNIGDKSILQEELKTAIESEENFIVEKSDIVEVEEVINKEDKIVIETNDNVVTSSAEVRVLKEELELLRDRLQNTDEEDNIELRNKCIDLENQIKELKKQKNTLIEEFDKSKIDNIDEIRKLKETYEDTLNKYQIARNERDSEIEKLNKVIENLTLEISETKLGKEDFTNLKNIEINTLKSKIENLESKIISDKNEIDVLLEEMEALTIESKKLDELANELTNLKVEYDNIKNELETKEKNYDEMNIKFTRLSESIFMKLGRKATAKAMITDKLKAFSEVGKLGNLILIATGSNESIADANKYLDKLVSNSNIKCRVIDLNYDTFLDYALEARGDIKKNLYDYMEDSSVQFSECVIGTRYNNVSYARICKGYINDTYLLTMNWSRLLRHIENNPSVLYVMNLGSIVGTIRGVILNSLSGVCRINVISRFTTINIRSTLASLSAFQYLEQIQCICEAVDITKIPQAYEKMKIKYPSQLINNSTVIKAEIITY